MSEADAHLQALRTLIAVSKRVHSSLDLVPPSSSRASITVRSTRDHCRGRENSKAHCAGDGSAGSEGG